MECVGWQFILSILSLFDTLQSAKRCKCQYTNNNNHFRYFVCNKLSNLWEFQLISEHINENRSKVRRSYHHCRREKNNYFWRQDNFITSNEKMFARCYIIYYYGLFKLQRPIEQFERSFIYFRKWKPWIDFVVQPSQMGKKDRHFQQNVSIQLNCDNFKATKWCSALLTPPSISGL